MIIKIRICDNEIKAKYIMSKRDSKIILSSNVLTFIFTGITTWEISHRDDKEE